MIFFIIFLMIPLIEIALFITVGEEIGLFMTLLLCVLAAMIGTALIRHQGLQTLFSARTAFARGTTPLEELFDGVCVTIAGVLFIIPGFFTDTIGFALLVPRLRTWLRAALKSRFNLQGEVREAHYHQSRDPDVIEAEYERINEKDKP